MDYTAYSTLPGTDVGYPEDRAHAYLKLFSHAWDFGRVDLAAFWIEWILYLILTAFVTVKAGGLVKWDFVKISIPLYIALVIGAIRSVFCGKRSRCAIVSRAYFVTFVILIYAFLIIRIEDYVSWNWHLVFIPMYVALGILVIAVGANWFWVVCTHNDDRLFKGFLFVLWTSLPSAVAFLVFLACKLENTLHWSWWRIFGPLWAFYGLVLITTPFFFIYFPDRSFTLDRVGSSFGKSIKPRYRVNLIYMITAALNIPIFLFNVFLCLRLEENKFPWPVVFSPLFVAEIVALACTQLCVTATHNRQNFRVNLTTAFVYPQSSSCSALLAEREEHTAFELTLDPELRSESFGKPESTDTILSL